MSTLKASSPPGLFDPTPRKQPPMKSTWHLKERSSWTFYQKFVSDLDIVQQPAHRPAPPVHAKTDPVPVYPVWKQHLYLFPRAVAPLIIHRLFTYLTGFTLSPFWAFWFYGLSNTFILVRSIRKFNEMGRRFGFYDGAAPRDGCPDQSSAQIFWSLVGVAGLRPMLCLMVAYDRSTEPSLSLWLPLQGFLYATTLDLLYYVFHRSMHTVPWLWKFHQTHHATRHPNPLLSAFADVEQEWFDVVIIPALTWLIMPVDFSTWFVISLYIAYTEAMGHSGIRVYFPTPLTAPFLRPFGAELSLEDHELHHRYGWREAHNYGKQTRLWDVVFGTSRPRIESREENLDWKTPVW